MEAVSSDELSMQQSLVFADSIKDLKTLRSQLYSAAEYFEMAYTKDEQQQTVVGTLKDYAVKALVNTVDHLGSISFKISSLVDQKVDDVAGAGLRVACIEQRMETCRFYMDLEGLAQQSLVLTAPKYYKRYTVPGDASAADAARGAVPNFREINRIRADKGDTHQFHGAARSALREKQPSLGRLRTLARTPSSRARSVSPSHKARSPSSSTTSSSPRSANLPTSAEEKRAAGEAAAAATGSSNPLMRSSSTSRRTSLLKSASFRVQSPAEQRKLVTVMLHAEREAQLQQQQQPPQPQKSKKFLKSILSRRKSKKDPDAFSTYLEEY